MGLIKEPFDQMVQTLGATHHWPMTGPDPLNNELLGGSTDLSLANLRDLTAEYGQLLDLKSTLYARSDGNNWALTMNGLPTHYTNAGLSEYTLVLFYRADNEMTSGGIMDFDGVGHIDGPAGFHMHAFKVHSDGTYQRHHNDKSGTRSSATVDPTTDGVGEGLINPWGSSGVILVGHILYFPTALTAEDLTTIYNQRPFLGRIAGTATVDGQGAPATVRGISRSDSSLVGETTAAADGSYEIWTTSTSSQDTDVLAIPPAGVAARPLVHGPIAPIDEN